MFSQLAMSVFMFYAWIEVDQNGHAAFIGPKNGNTLTTSLEEARSHKDQIRKYLNYQRGNSDGPAGQERKEGKLIELQITDELDHV